MSIIDDALKKVAGKRKDLMELREEAIDRTSSRDIKRIASKRTKWNILSSIGTLFIVGFAIVAFLYNAEYFSSFIYSTRQTIPLPKSVDLGRRISSSFIPVTKPKEETPSISLTLTGIIEGVGESLAVINDQICRVGDFVDEAKVIDITSDRVTLLYKGEEIRLRIE